jgi:methionyl aminopeptidase
MQRKSAEQIALMRTSGLITWEAHQIAAEWVRPGITTAEIDAAVESHIIARGAKPLFKGVPGVVPFPATTCISVNEAVVHGIPGKRALREGDIVSVDIGCRYKWWCSDAAQTHAVGQIDPRQQHLLRATEDALALALNMMKPEMKWSVVARAIDAYVRGQGLSIVRGEFGLTGHGIGRNLWEAPRVPNYTNRHFERHEDFILEPGIVIAVEPMVNQLSGEVRVTDDYWTVVTRDGLPSAHFEHTIAMTPDGPQILTSGPNGEGWATKAPAAEMPLAQ